MEKGKTSIADTVSVTMNTESIDKNEFMARVNKEFAKLKGFDIDSYKVVATENISQRVGKYSVKIVAKAYGQTFVAQSGSNNTTDMFSVYAGTNGKLRASLSREREQYKNK